MSNILICKGDDLCQNPKRGNPFLSGIYYPARKRLRVDAPYVCREEEPYQQKGQEVSIESLPDECLFEILRRLPGGRERGACAGVSKRWLVLLSSIRRSERSGGAADLSRVSGSKRDSMNKDEDMVGEHDGFLSRKLEGKKKLNEIDEN